MSSTEALLEEPSEEVPTLDENHPGEVGQSVGTEPNRSIDESAVPTSGDAKTGSGLRALAAIILSIAIIVAVGVVVTRPPAGGVALDAPEDSALPVSIIRAGQLTAPDLSRSYSGVLMARQESLLSFERGGRLLTLAKEEGDTVRAGEQLAELDQENLDAAELRTRSELAASQARLDELVAGPRKQTIDAAKARVEQLAAEVELAKLDAERQNRLWSTNATSRAAYDSAIFGLRVSENALAAQRAALDELEEGTRKEQIAIQKANVAGMQAALKEIEAQRRDSRIEAPFDGKIQTRLVDEGVVINTGTAAFQLVSHEIEARFGLPPALAGTMSPGMPVTTTLRGETRNGWVDRVEPVVDRATRTRGVYVRFAREPNESDTTSSTTSSCWVAGELPDLLFNEPHESGSNDRFWLPTKSLTRAGRGLWTVLVVPGEDDAAICERRAVELLKTDGERALIQGMIRRDERVIADGLHRLTAGLLVTPIEGSDNGE